MKHKKLGENYFRERKDHIEIPENGEQYGKLNN